MWGVASQDVLFLQTNDLFQSRGLRCGALPRRGVFFFNKTTFFKAGGSGVRRCLAGTLSSQKTTPFSFPDNTFRVNVAKSQCLPIKYSLSELAGRGPELGGLGPELTGLATRNDTRSAARSLPSTRTGGKDDGS